MKNDPLTLRKFFKYSAAKTDQEPIDRLSEQPRFKEAVTAVSKISPVASEAVATEAAGTLTSFFDLSLPELLAAAWCQRRELKKFTEPDARKSREAHWVGLASHNVKSEFHPKLQILLAGKMIEELPFDAIIALEIQGAILKIQRGKIRELHSLSAQGSCRLEFKGRELWKNEGKVHRMPAPVIFDPGFDLANL